MNIGYLYNFRAFPPKGGNHVHAMELAQGFLHSGHNVFVVDDPTMLGVTSFSSSTADLHKFMETIDILYVRFDARFVRQWSVLTECSRIAKGVPIVWEINSPANETLAYSWLSGKRIDAKESLIRRLRRWLHATKKIPLIIKEEQYRRSIAKNVGAAICVSKSLEKYAHEELDIRDVLVLPNGGPKFTEDEITKRQKRRQYKGFTVLYTGSSIYPWQGLDYLADVIALAKHEAPDINFLLAVNQKKDLPSSENVIVLEHLNREEIFDAICAADVCVSLHPEYPWSKYNFHNSPMKMFEYMACMKPVVASNHSQMRDIFKDGGGVLCENNPQDILNKLVALKNDPAKAARIGRRGWKRIHSEFSWQRNVEETLKVFDRLIK